MAPTGLQSFMEKNRPRAYHRVDMLSEIRSYRERHNRRPLIVLDGSCSRAIFLEKDRSRYLTGGQYKLYKRRVDEFIDFFQGLDAQLVVFFDGGTVRQMRSRWIARKTEGTMKTQQIFDCLDNGDQVEEWDILLPCNIVVLIKSRFAERCMVKMSTFQECDAEIVRYANANKAMAVLSQDADFAVSQGDWQYWSYKDIDYNTKTVYTYDRAGLAEVLGLRVDQLPLFRTMIGNDYVIENTLDKFYRSLRIRRYGESYNKVDKILKVSKYIKNYDNSKRSLQQLSRQVFSGLDNSALLTSSVDSYFGREYNQQNEFLFEHDAKWNAVLKLTLSRLQEAKIGPDTFDVMLNHVLESSNSWEDFRKPDMPPAGLLWRPLRARIYAILLRDCPLDKPVEEWICAEPETMCRATLVQPETPPGCEDLLQSYSLMDFWTSEVDLSDAAWKLFGACFNPNLPVAGLQGLDERLIVCALVLLRMRGPCSMARHETEAFLMTCALCSTREQVDDLSSPDAHFMIDTRALRLSTAFLRGIHTVAMLLEALGFTNLPKECVQVWNIFDGALFQTFIQNEDEMDKHRREDLFIEGIEFVDEFQHLF